MTAGQRGRLGPHGTEVASLPVVGAHGPERESFSQFADLLRGGNRCRVKWGLMSQKGCAESG